MREVGAHRGRDDDRERSADRKRHAHFFGHAEENEGLVENRHDDRAAADAKEAGENSGEPAREKERGRERKKLFG